MAESVADITNYVRTSLGAGDGTSSGQGVEVELTDSDVEALSSQAIGLLDSRVPLFEAQKLTISKNTQRYPLDIDDETTFLGIIEVNIIDAERIADGLYLTEYPAIEAVDYSQSVPIGDIFFQKQRRKDIKNFLDKGTVWEEASEWDADAGKRVPVIYIDLPENVYNAGYKCEVVYSVGREYSDDPRYGLPAIPRHLREWLRDYMVALAKGVVGMKRRKFQGIASEKDPTEPTDGNLLVTESVTEKKELEAALLKMQSQQHPRTG